jgi:peptidoglycan/xylan/chitin deacetylase (PgdA/CDA1 family)
MKSADLKKQLLVVSYHYISDSTVPENSAIFPVSKSQFRNQLLALGEHYRFIGQNDLINLVESDNEINEPLCLITFDDGLRCQSEIAFPVLESLGIPGVFFVNGSPIETKRGLLVHKIHFVRSKIENKKFSAELEAFLNSIRSSRLDYEQGLQEARKIYRYGDDQSAWIKWCLNHQLTHAESTILIDELFKNLIKNEKEWCESLYMSEEQLRILDEKGFLGSHGYGHYSMGNLSFEQIDSDLKKDIDFFKKQKLSSPRSFSFPYGSCPKDLKKFSALLEKYGYKIGFTVERAVNRSLKNSLYFARLDTNDALMGKQALMKKSGASLEYFREIELGRNLFANER